MLFNSLEYIFYFIIVVSIYFILPYRLRWIWLLGGSYFFYMNWNPEYAFLMGISTLVTYLSGILIENTITVKDLKKREIKKKVYVCLSFLINLLILFFFKYFNFLGENLESLFQILNIGLKVPKFNILLPVGISFYTFQALSYTMDVYRGDIKAQRNLGKYALFVSFFPQLVAGPIERSTNLLKQLDNDYDYNFERVKGGLQLMLWGFFKKIVIADRISVIVNTVYNTPYKYEGLPLIIATIFFAFQIYCDFSSYSDIAIGSANVMGYNLMKNFDRPYFSKSIAEFWRRWHISLGTWFKDYLYFPLGGNKINRYRNIMIVFLVSGLWHGASWNFIIWGGIHGIYQILGIELIGVRKRVRDYLKLNSDMLFYKIYKVLSTFILVNLTWIFFRANTFKDAQYILKKIFVCNWSSTLKNGELFRLGLDKKDLVVAITFIILLNFVEFYQRDNFIEKMFLKFKTRNRWIIYYVSIIIIVILGYYGDNTASQFIYFQF